MPEGKIVAFQVSFFPGSRISYIIGIMGEITKSFYFSEKTLYFLRIVEKMSGSDFLAFLVSRLHLLFFWRSFERMAHIACKLKFTAPSAFLSILRIFSFSRAFWSVHKDLVILYLHLFCSSFN
jgi:hypothetical protein